MIVAIPAPKPRAPRAVVAAYVYAALSMILAVIILMGIGGFHFAGVNFETPGSPVFAALVASLHIYALPFLLQLRLSPLARYFSALFSLLAPLFSLGGVLYAQSEKLVTSEPWSVAVGLALVALGVASFLILNGPRALRFSKK